MAQRVGYRSESAFNRAFRRAHGRTPGVFARQGSLFSEQVAAPEATGAAGGPSNMQWSRDGRPVPASTVD